MLYVFLHEWGLLVQMLCACQRCSVLPSRILNSPQEVKWPVCPQARRNELDTHGIRCRLRKMGWLSSRHGLQSGNQRPNVLLLTMQSLDHLCPLLRGRRSSSGNHHSLRCFHCFVIPNPAITTAVTWINNKLIRDFPEATAWSRG